MAANISKANGKNEMMYVGEVPWHGLGQKLDKLATAEEAIAAAGLDWTVSKRELFFQSKNGTKQTTGDRLFAMVRDDNERFLGTAGPDWMPFQNKTAFSFTDAIIQEKEAVYETAGALKGGSKVWLMAKLNGVMRIKGSDDVLDRYLLLSNSHEAGHSLQVKLTTVRVVCQNTLTQALGERGQAYWRIAHTSGMNNRVADAREALGLVNVRFQELQEKMNRLAEVKISATDFAVFAETIGYKPDAEDGVAKVKWDGLQDAFETSPGAQLKSAKGTLWGALNAVTFSVDHNGNFKTSDAKMNSVFYGNGDALKTKALNTALAMAK